MKSHHFKTDEAWLDDVEKTARAVRRQNEVCRETRPVELADSETLYLVRLARAGLSRSGEQHE
jgi:hypothetical protein